MSVEQSRQPSQPNRFKGLVPDQPLPEPTEDPTVSEEQRHAQRLQRELLGVYGNVGAAQQQEVIETDLKPNQVLAGLEGRAIPDSRQAS